MNTTLSVRDESTTGEVSEPITLEFLTDRITVRELIRSRVYQEVKDYNQHQDDVFTGLVQPTETEQTLNGCRMKRRRTIDWQKQFDKAIEAFEQNQMLVLIDDRQAESLEQPITISPDTQVTFMKLTPLVGG